MRRELYGLISALLLLAACSGPQPAVLSDGVWQVTAMDGVATNRSAVVVIIEDGRIIGGYDGCNNWGVDLSMDEPMIVSDAKACPDDPVISAYRELTVLATAQTRVEIAAEPAHIRAGGHDFTLQSAEN